MNAFPRLNLVRLRIRPGRVLRPAAPLRSWSWLALPARLTTRDWRLTRRPEPARLTNYASTTLDFAPPPDAAVDAPAAATHGPGRLANAPQRPAMANLGPGRS